ncbi:MAG: EAL domain-containing protein [Betaproteobacteria bacterium]
MGNVANPAKALSIMPEVVAGIDGSEASTADVMMEALHAIRQHFAMEVAFVSEFSQGRRIFRYVDAAADRQIIKIGDSNPLDESYCVRVVDGRLPGLIPDACQLPAALELPVTTALPVGAHLSVPIHLRDGRVYGTFCCFSTRPDPSLRERDLAMMQVFADFAGKQIDRKLAQQRTRDEKLGRIQSIIDQDEFSMVYQPIHECLDRKVVGFESLTRFAPSHGISPETGFREAGDVGLGVELETQVISKVLADIGRLPENVYVSVNASPDTILSGVFEQVLEGLPLKRIVVEVTEHAAIKEYARIATALAPLRAKGVRLAVDDAGAGYASFRHILELGPELIKLDISLTRDIDSNRNRRALAAALIRFAEETGSTIISEGVETEAELTTLNELGACMVQGYLLGRPMPIDAAATWGSPA